MPITLTINGKTILAEPGTTVLEAARANDIYIPTLCYAPKLKPFGGCRLCVVEIEKMGGMPAACTTPAGDGMVVRTDSPAVQDQRRETLSLLLSEHPYTCLTCGEKNGCVEFQGTIRKAAVTTGCNYCPKNGQCEIQDVVEYLEMQDVPYPIAYRGLPVEQDDPFFDRDMNLCIVCNRCVRACADVRHAAILALIERGDHTVVGTVSGRSLVEAGCQFCGACVDACPTGALFDKKSKWEGLPHSIVPSVCAYCSVGCAVNIQARGKRILRAVGNDGGVTNGGEICVRGRFGMVEIIHSGTRLKTPLLRHGTRQVPVSWEQALEAAGRGLSQYQGDEVAVIGSATATNEELFLLQKLARTVLKTSNVAITTAMPDVKVAMQTLKSPGAQIANIRAARTILAIGANAFDSHPIVGLEIRHALSQGARLVTIDPARTKLSARSEAWLRPFPGSDHILLAGIIRALADLGKGSAAPRISLGRVAAITGVSQAAITAATAVLAGSCPALIVYGSGVTHQPGAQHTLNALSSLAATLGAEMMGLPGEANIAGAYDMGMDPALLPGYRRSRRPGRTYEGILEAIRSGQIKALYLAGDMPALPELAQLKFLLVQGIAHSDIIKQAHVALPVTTFAEMNGTMTNLEGRVQRLRKAIEPVGQARPGWLAVQDVARAMGAGWKASAWSDVLAEIAAAVPVYATVTEQGLDSAGGVLRRFEQATALSGGLSLNDWRPAANDRFPLTLIAERNRLYYRGVSLVADVKGMAEIRSENILRMSPDDAGHIGVGDGQTVTVTSAAGSAEYPAVLDNALLPGHVALSVNPVVGSTLFAGGMPQEKLYPVRVEVVAR